VRSISKNSNLVLIVLLISACITGLITQYLSFSNEYIYAYRDSIFRIDAARRFIDAFNPGFFNQIGTVWLPLPNIILLPFAANDFLWKTGLAGSIPGFILYLLNIAAIYKTFDLLLKDKFAVIIGSILYFTNPNILYFQTTPMSEQLYLTLFSVSLYLLIKWIYEGNKRVLICSGIAVALASLTRYDAWVFALFSSVLVFIISYKKKNKPFLSFILFSLPAGLAVLWWLIHNYIYYKDSLEFMRGQFSTLHQLKWYEENGRLLTKYNLLLSLKVYFSDLMLYSGLLSLILAGIGIAFYTFRNKINISGLMLYLSVIAIPGSVIMLYLGQIIIEIPDSVPSGYFNSRYGLYAFPGIVLFSGLAVSHIAGLLPKWKKTIQSIVIVALIFQLAFFLKDPVNNIASIAEAEYAGYKNSETYKASLFLRDNYKGGNILYDFSVFALSPFCGISLKDRITYHTYLIGEKALKDPAAYAKWIMVYRKSSNDKVFNAIMNYEKFQEYYNIAFSKDGLELFKRKD